ncbi:RNA-binding protein [Mesorhizobium sp. ORM8.1]
MPTRRLADSGIFEPEELSLLQEVFHQICAHRRIARQSDQGQAAAEALIYHYKAGLRGKQLLQAVLPKKELP